MFGDNGVRPGDHAAMTAADHSTATTVSTGDFNADGQMSANAVIGASVKNASNDTVGTVEDAYEQGRHDQEDHRLSRRFSWDGHEECGGELERHQFQPRRQVGRAEDDLDQGLAEGDARLQYERRIPAPRAG